MRYIIKKCCDHTFTLSEASAVPTPTLALPGSLLIFFLRNYRKYIIWKPYNYTFTFSTFRPLTRTFSPGQFCNFCRHLSCNASLESPVTNILNYAPPALGSHFNLSLRHFYFLNLSTSFVWFIIGEPFDHFSILCTKSYTFSSTFRGQRALSFPRSSQLTYIRIVYIKEFLSVRGLLRIFYSACAASLPYGAASNEHYYSMIA